MKDMSFLIGKIKMVKLFQTLTQGKSKQDVHRIILIVDQEITTGPIMQSFYQLNQSKFTQKMLILGQPQLVMLKMRLGRA